MKTIRLVAACVFLIALCVPNQAEAQSGRNGRQRRPVLVTLLLGQSNMDGGGHVNDLPEQFPLEQPQIDYAWSSTYVDGPELGPLRLRPANNGIPRWYGPELTLGMTIPKARYQRVFLKYARGGTSLHKDWDPEDGETFQNAMSWVATRVGELKQRNMVAVLDSIIWVQGEADV